MAALFFFVVIFLINSSLVTSDDCKILDELDAYLTEFFTKFYTATSCENIFCLDYALYGHKNRCKLSKFARSVKTQHCNYIRTDINKYDKAFIDKFHPNTRRLEGRIYGVDTDAEIVCNTMSKFNKIPISNRSKKDYAKIFNSTIKYVTFHWIEIAFWEQNSVKQATINLGELNYSTRYYVQGCYYDIIVAIAKYFNVPAPYSWDCVKSFKDCQNEMSF